MPPSVPAIALIVQTLPSLRDVRVLVIGDVMLDRYWRGEADRVSPEAPVPVVDVRRIVDQPGGAANVALNVVSLGAECTLVGVVGADDAAASIRRTLHAAGVRCAFVEADDWQTIVKLRIISQQQQLLRADFERVLDNVADRVQALAEEHMPGASSVVLSDYDKGAVAQPWRLIQAAAQARVPVVVDPKRKPFASYAGAVILKPNAQEFRAAVGSFDDDDDLVRRARLLAQEHGFGALVVTQGGQGMTVVGVDGARRHLPASPVEVFDVTGAGDTAAAALGVCVGLGMPAADCAEVANVASGLVVAKSGTAAVSGPELNRALAGSSRAARGIMTRTQLFAAVEDFRGRGERIVFTNGCFDILHAGHVAYLEEARALGDRLIVAVNGDESVRRLKGTGRPVNGLERRMKVLSALAAVDWVVAFDEDTPEPLLELLRPDVLVKGGDYAPETVVGAEIVNGYGGAVRVLSLVDDCSTTAIVEHIRRT